MLVVPIGDDLRSVLSDSAFRHSYNYGMGIGTSFYSVYLLKVDFVVCEYQLYELRIVRFKASWIVD